MSFEKEMSAHTAEVNQIIEAYLPKEGGFQNTLLQAINYSIKAGGKRIRPMLMLETYRLFDGSGKVIEPFMAAMEMIHTHSLIHDDLPAIDNDEYRRGRKTTHIVYGEAMGILAGDGMLNLAYETAASAFEMDAANVRVGQAMRILAGKSGIYGMIGGQAVDVEAVDQTFGKDKLDFIYSLKTAALIEGSMMIGAVLAGAGEEEIAAVEKIAADVGLAFQIRDDILDVSSTMEELGKPVLSDEKNLKTTYVSIEGIEKAEADVELVSERAIQALDALDVKNEFLRKLIWQLVNRTK